MKVLVANTGTNDLKYDSKKLSRTREDAKKILEDLQGVIGDELLLNSEANSIDLPILLPAINSFLLLEPASGPIDVLFLIVTNQDEMVDKKFRSKDTIYVGKIIKFLLENNVDKFANKVKMVRLLYLNKNPNILDDTFNYYRDFVKKIGDYLGSNRPTTWVMLTGGTQACNFALLDASINSSHLMGYKQYIYVNELTEEVVFLETQNQLLLNRVKETFDIFLERWDYHAAMQLSKRLTFEDKIVTNFLQVLGLRLNFRFEEALSVIEEMLVRANGNPRMVIEKLEFEIKNLHDSIGKALKSKSGLASAEHIINELYWNMHIQYQTGRYVDFLGRFYRLSEFLMQLEIAKMEGCGLNALRKKLKPGGGHVSRKDMLDYLKDNSIRKTFCMWLENGNELCKHRNNSILGHSFQGGSPQNLNELWGGKDLFDDTVHVLGTEFNVIIGNNPYEAYKYWIKERFTSTLRK
ncbi:MAG: hypothetical protein FH749_14515 [Firmicutes bacterium]|nr:hypothetical protein [Bacillota bacterium]